MTEKTVKTEQTAMDLPSVQSSTKSTSSFSDALSVFHEGKVFSKSIFTSDSWAVSEKSVSECAGSAW